MMKSLVRSAFAIVVALTALNASYLAAFDSPTIFYFANVIAHVALGGLLATALALTFLRYLRGMRLGVSQPDRGRLVKVPVEAAAGPNSWLGHRAAGSQPAASPIPPGAEEAVPTGRSLEVLSRWVYVLAAIAMVATGARLVRTGTSSPYLPTLRVHEAASASFLVLLLLMMRSARVPSRTTRLLTALVGACLLFPIGVRLADLARPAHVATITNPPLPPESPYEEGGGKQSPFFPSSNRTASGEPIRSDFFLESRSCGNTGCHPDITAQWESSAHHFSSFNNQWYRKSIEYMQDTIGTKPSKWCGGCHDMAILLTGRMDTPIREQIHTPEAQAGIGCLVCHSIVHVPDTMGQGGFTLEYPEMHRLVASKNPVLQFLHDRMVLLDPAPHKATMLKEFHRRSTPEFCSSCHKVHLDVPVNHYRWFRGFNDYDAWQQSGVSMQGARAFYYPDAPKKCGSCHMPLIPSDDKGNIGGQVHSHRFPGANTALPVANDDPVQFVTVKKFLQDGILTLDIFAASEEPDDLESQETGTTGPERRRESPDAYRRAPEAVPAAQSMLPEEGGLVAGAPAAAPGPLRAVIAPIDRAAAGARPGSTVRIDVVARTRKIGHFFPGGTVDAFDVWMELEAEDAAGRVLYWNGWVADGGKGPVDPGAHFYRALMLDDHGNRINKRNAWAAKVAAYARLIPPGAADTVHFRVRLPRDVAGPVRLTARMNYRKFSWWNTQWAFAGVRDPSQTGFELSERYDDGQWVFTGDTSDVSGKTKQIPDLPTIVVAEKTALLSIGDRVSPPAPSAADRERWNDYGIGLLLQKDYRGAAAAFETVTAIEPAYADGWVNRGRVAVEEGDHAKALEYTEAALKLDPALPKAHYFRGLALRTFGRYDEAIASFSKTLSTFPRDRVVLNALGRVLFLKREFSRAVETFQRTLAVDPEDVTAHYNLMLCFRGLRDEASSRAHEKLYVRFKADESAQFVTGGFRLLHPEENRERQAVHEHESTWTPENLYAASGDRYRDTAERTPERAESKGSRGTHPDRLSRETPAKDAPKPVTDGHGGAGSAGAAGDGL